MVVIATRQPGHRPETIRTRLARFMPTRAASGWSVAWSAQVEHAEDITDEHELQVAEHLGCYGTVVGHALAQAELTVQQLRLSADCTVGEGGAQTVTIEVRGQIEGADVDQRVFDAIVRRAEPNCPVLKGLASEVTLRLVAVLDQSGDSFAPRTTQKQDSTPAAAPSPTNTRAPSKPAHASSAESAPAATAGSAATTATPTHAAMAKSGTAGKAKPAGMQAMPRIDHAAILGRVHAPKWLTARMAILLTVAFAVFATLPNVLSASASA